MKREKVYTIRMDKQLWDFLDNKRYQEKVPTMKQFINGILGSYQKHVEKKTNESLS